MQDFLIKGCTPADMLSRVICHAVERQRAEGRLRESERFLRATLEALPSLIAILDESGTVLMANHAWRSFATSGNSAKKYSVLLIEDDPGDARLVAEVLKQAGNIHFALEMVDTLTDGLAKLSVQQFDVVLLDLSLPDSFGVSTMDQVLDQAPDQPIIVLTGAKDEQLAMELSKKGAQDYLVKSEMPGGVLTRSIAYAVERKAAELKLNQTVEALKAANHKIAESLSRR